MSTAPARVSAPLALLVLVVVPPLLVAIVGCRAIDFVGRDPGLITVEDEFDGAAVGERLWRWISSGPGPRLAGGRAILETRPGSTVFLEARFVDQNEPGQGGVSYEERLDVRAAIRRDGRYLMLTEAWFGQTLLWIQITDYGVHVTYPNERGERTGHEVRHAAGADGGHHTWSLIRGGRDLVLEIDGSPVWRGPARAPLSKLRLGDVAAGEEHAGIIELDGVRYERRPLREDGRS